MKRWQIIVLVVLLDIAVTLFIRFPFLSPANTTVISPAPTTVPLPSAPGPVTLLFTGDIMLSRSVGDLIASLNDWTWPFEHIASVTAAADLTFGNLETTISSRGIQNGCGFCFRSDPRVVAGLTLAGFDVLSVANNHVWDYGPQAFIDTLSALTSVGMDPVGGGENIIQARNGIVRTVRGARIGYLAYTDLLPRSAQAGPATPGVSEFAMDQMKEDIGAMRHRADVVIVSFHTGTEYEVQHNANQELIYHAAIDVGADLIIGTHPHVVQEVEQYHMGWIAYSLGNFVFDQNFSSETTHSVMLRVTIQDRKVANLERIPITISHQYQPSLTAGP